MYSTGTAASATAVLQALATFATSAGWTVNNNAAEASGWWLSLQKGSTYINLWVDTTGNNINCYGATGFAVGGGHAGQASTSPVNICNPGAGPYVGYHFFSTTSGANYLHVVIEISSGVFRHIHVGSVQGIGGAAPCTYIEASNWTTTSVSQGQNFPDSASNYVPWGTFASSVNIAGFIGLTVDSTFRWFSTKNSTPARKISLPQTNGVLRNSITRSPNTFNGLTVLLTMPIFVERAAGNIYSWIGDVPDMRAINITNVNPKDEITIGTDVWKCFPVCAKNSTINTIGAGPSSGIYGYAFKKNA